MFTSLLRTKPHLAISTHQSNFRQNDSSYSVIEVLTALPRQYIFVIRKRALFPLAEKGIPHTTKNLPHARVLT